MSIKVSAYTITIGNQQSLSVAQGEDREFRLTFNDSSGTARDMTGAAAITLTVRSRTTGIEIFSRLYSGFQGSATAGTPRFQVIAADTDSQADGPYDCWVEWTDASGYTEQLLVESTFEILTGAQPNSITTPPGVPVVYGLNWYTGYTGSWWTSLTGGYAHNDAVIAYDGSLGCTAVSSFRCIASGVTYFPINSSLLVASGWQYVGQHGGYSAAETVYGSTGIDNKALIKVSSTAGLYETLLTSDDVAKMVGVAAATCAGSGMPFLGYFIPGIITPMLSDGTAAIPPGSAVTRSSSVHGRIAATADLTVCIGYNIGATAPATLDYVVSVR